jgi:hypothetical protein
MGYLDEPGLHIGAKSSTTISSWWSVRASFMFIRTENISGLDKVRDSPQFGAVA